MNLHQLLLRVVKLNHGAQNSEISMLNLQHPKNLVGVVQDLLVQIAEMIVMVQSVETNRFVEVEIVKTIETVELNVEVAQTAIVMTEDVVAMSQFVEVVAIVTRKEDEDLVMIDVGMTADVRRTDVETTDVGTRIDVGMTDVEETVEVTVVSDVVTIENVRLIQLIGDDEVKTTMVKIQTGEVRVHQKMSRSVVVVVVVAEKIVEMIDVNLHHKIKVNNYLSILTYRQTNRFNIFSSS